MTRRVAFRTVGCRLNQAETDALASEFQRAGYAVVEFDSGEADAYIINTCTVTAQSDQKCRNLINQAGRAAGDPVVVVTGCLTEVAREALEGREHVTYVVANDHKPHIFSLVDGHFRGEVVHASHLPADRFGYAVADKTFHTRSMIKIQDGCDNCCTFCIVPAVRGRAVSRPVDDVLRNVAEILDLGYREIVLTGVNIGRYRDGDIDFAGLLARVLAIPGDHRVRVSSMEPDDFGDGFYELLGHARMTPHLHLCLQSGSDRVLQRMRRRYTVDQYCEMLQRVKREVPDINLTTDVLVGFPGETDADFAETAAVVREWGFTHIHTFRYSVRPRTRAARMDDQISDAVKIARSAHIRELSEQNRVRYYAAMRGRAQRLLVERIEQGCARGYGEHYVPLELPGDGLDVNAFYSVEVGAPVPGKRALACRLVG